MVFPTQNMFYIFFIFLLKHINRIKFEFVTSLFDSGEICTKPPKAQLTQMDTQIVEREARTKSLFAL